jgi:hypothetical protein
MLLLHNVMAAQAAIHADLGWIGFCEHRYGRTEKE